MNNKPRYTLGSKERLKSRKAIEQLFAAGESFSLFPFRVVYQVHKDAGVPLQAAFSVSKRYFKKAVHRNRIKRLMREAYRLQKPGIKEVLENNNQQLHVFLMYTGNEIPAHSLVMEKTAMVLKKLQKIIHEAVGKNT